MGFLTVVLLSFALGVTSFAVGNLPLAFSFSRLRMAQLSTLGVGLLLGAALGVIIPEGIETIYDAGTPNPTETIAFTLLGGFTLMLLVEQYLIPGHEHDHSGYALAPSNPREVSSRPSSPTTTSPTQARATPITFGLVIHSLADGLALGASSAQGDSAGGDPLTLIVFFALMIHKAPTALALSSSLLPVLSRNKIRLHIAVFSLATPVGAILSHLILDISGASRHWTGIALAFSGGTFLYVATVLQPIRDEPEVNDGDAPRQSKLSRLVLVVIGMFAPILLSMLLGHGH